MRVLEVAAWTFVPAAGAILAEWGAEVIKVEPRTGGDPQRGLVNMGLVGGGPGAVNHMVEVPNRGKKSIGVDLSTSGGRQVIFDLAKTCDVFLTSYLPARRRQFGIDVDQIRAANPSIVYVRGSAYGPQGDEAGRPGYDGVSYWARGGVGDALTPGDAEPIRPRPAFGDVLGGMAIAGGIAAALYKRKSTGIGTVVDVSLLGLAAWNLGPDITASALMDGDPLPVFTHNDLPNPLVGTYRTRDGRWLTLMLLQSSRFFPEVMTLLGRPELISDERFVDDAARYANRGALIGVLDEIFALHTAEEWKAKLQPLSGAWAIVQAPGELATDPAVVANGYIPTVTTVQGSPYPLAVNPVQFDEQRLAPHGAPEHGQHTEEVLMEAGFDWDRIDKLKTDGAVL